MKMTLIQAIAFTLGAIAFEAYGYLFDQPDLFMALHLIVGVHMIAVVMAILAGWHIKELCDLIDDAEHEWVEERLS